jgi:ATP adenylyltransferase
MDRLCTPWRYDYVSGEQKEDGCVFCNRLQCDDRAQYVLHRGERWYLILNLYPYNSGHLLLVLGRHASRIADCTPDELVDLARYLKLMEDVLQEAFRPDGINCGYNGGTSAGAGIPGHLHVHMLPRWAGDTNFMSTVGQTRVMPQTLDQVWERLKPVVDRLSPGFGATAARPEGA